MPLETANYISDLDAANPNNTDLKSQGDDHLRLIKKALKASFPNVAGPVTLTHQQLNGLPGAISMWPLAAAPAGYLVCDGQAVSRATYAALFAVLGTAFGAGDGVTTFALPNYVDRMPIGAGSAYAAGSIGGSKDAVAVSHTHSLTVSGTSAVETAPHSHVATVNDPGHAHTFPYLPMNGTAAGGGSFATGVGANHATSTNGTGISVSNSTQTASHTHGVTLSGTTAAAGSSGVNANLPPYLGIYFIVKT